MDRRIATPTGKSEEAKEIIALIERLTAPQDSAEPGLFESKQKLMMFAAALGASLQTRAPLEQRDSNAAIRFDVFEKNSDEAFVAAVGVAEKCNLNILRPTPDNESELGTVFEEYAHAGLLQLKRRIRGSDPLQVLVDLVLGAQYGDTSGDSIPDFPDDILHEMFGE